MDKEISKELLDLCKKQDSRAQHELYRACYSFLMSVCSRYTINKEDSESLLNQSYPISKTNGDSFAPNKTYL